MIWFLGQIGFKRETTINWSSTGRREHGVRMHVMVGGTHGLLAAGYTATRKLANFHFGLGVERDTESLCVVRGLRVDLPQVVEDSVGLGDFFCGLVLRTRRSR